MQEKEIVMFAITSETISLEPFYALISEFVFMAILFKVVMISNRLSHSLF